MQLPKADYRLIENFADTLEKACPRDFTSAVLYGSAVRGNYVPGKSDINLLLAFERSTFKIHQLIYPLFLSLRSKLQVSPLVIGMDVAQRTFECFALKFLSIQRVHHLVSGRDIFQSFHVDRSRLAFLTEQELRNLRLRMIHSFLTRRKGEEQFAQLLFRTHSKAVIVISDILRVAGHEISSDYFERFTTFEKFFSVPFDPFRSIQRMKDKSELPSLHAAEELYGEIFEILDKILHIVETKGILS